MRMKNGIGVSEKLVTDWIALRASCGNPGSPPRKTRAPIMLMARNAKATESPTPMSPTRPPNRRTLAAVQLIRASSDRGRLGTPRRLASQQAIEPEHKLSRQQREYRRQRPEQPPFREHEILDRQRI